MHYKSKAAFVLACITAGVGGSLSANAAAIAEIGTNYVRISAGEAVVLPEWRTLNNALRLDVVSVETVISSRTSGDGVVVDRSSLTSGNAFIESAISASAKTTAGNAQIAMHREVTFSVTNIALEPISAAILYFQFSPILPLGSSFFPISRWASPPADSLMPPRDSLSTPENTPPIALVFDTAHELARAETSAWLPSNEDRFPASGLSRLSFSCSTAITSYPGTNILNYPVPPNGSACGVPGPDFSDRRLTFRTELDPGESFLASFSLGIRLEASAEPIPEPASLPLAAIGFAALGLAAASRRRRFALTQNLPAP